MNEKTHRNETPLAYYLKYNQAHDQDETVKLLLKAGSDPTGLPDTFLTKDKMRDYFNESIKDSDTVSFQHLLALQKKSGVFISNDELLIMIAKHFATNTFAKLVLNQPENDINHSVQERFKFLKTTQEVNAEIHQKIEAILIQQLSTCPLEKEQLLTKEHIESTRKEIILNENYRFKTTLINSGISDEAVQAIINYVLEHQSDSKLQAG